jgi:thioredoxin 1
MKKIAFLSFLVALISFSTIAQSGIKFEEDAWALVVSKAKEENKLIFLDAYTEWCGPCKMLQERVFPDADLGKYFGENFLSTKVDMEKGEGPALAKKYAVRAYPTLLFIDPNTQQVVHKVLGYKNVEQLKSVAVEALGKTASGNSSR